VGGFITINKRIKYVGYSSVLALLFSATSALAEQYWSEVDDLTELSTQPGFEKVSAIKERRLVMLDLASIRFANSRRYEQIGCLTNVNATHSRG
jgi:hypothetical protein